MKRYVAEKRSTDITHLIGSGSASCRLERDLGSKASAERAWVEHLDQVTCAPPETIVGRE
jgi:hypothetical protein